MSTDQAMTPSWPHTIKISPNRKQLSLELDDGTIATISAERLRVFSPSAEVRGHGKADRPPPVTGKENITIIAADLVGNYAVRLTFDDMHASGIYSWNYLQEICHQQEQMWRDHMSLLTNEHNGQNQ